jgi:hypothetical protein
MAAVLPAVPHFCMNYIPRGCSADRCTSLLYELHSIWLQCWPLYLTSVWTAFYVAIVLTAVPHFCMNCILHGYSADRCTSLLYELHSIWLQCWPLRITSVKFHYTWPHCLPHYGPSVWTTFHLATVLTALLHFPWLYDRFTSLLAFDRLTNSFDSHVINKMQNVCVYALLFSLGLHFVRCNFGPLRTGPNYSCRRAVAESVQCLSNYEKKLRKVAFFNLKLCDILGFHCLLLRDVVRRISTACYWSFDTMSRSPRITFLRRPDPRRFIRYIVSRKQEEAISWLTL